MITKIISLFLSSCLSSLKAAKTATTVASYLNHMKQTKQTNSQSTNLPVVKRITLKVLNKQSDLAKVNHLYFASSFYHIIRFLKKFSFHFRKSIQTHKDKHVFEQNENSFIRYINTGNEYITKKKYR